MAKTRQTPTFSRYEILDELGSGGMGIVYRARHKQLGWLVALKLLPPAVRDDSDARTRFEREVQALAQLRRHRHIAQIYDAELENGFPYLAIEYIEGSDLETLLRRDGPLSPAQAVKLGQQMASALVDVHAQGLIHRDVKASNIMIRSNGDAVLTDFGIVFAAEQSRISRGVVGTLAYMSPEQLEGATLDGRSDLYSLGIVLYEALSGRLPFPEQGTSLQNDLRLQLDILQASPPPLDDVPPSLNDLIQRCLAKKPAERFASATELATALANLQGISPATVVPAREAPPLEKSGDAHALSKLARRRRWPIAILIILVLVVGTWWSLEATYVYRQLHQAENLLRQDKLTTPAGNAAYDRVLTVLAIDSTNILALALRRGIADRFEELGWEQAQVGNGEQAQAYFDEGLRIDSLHPTLDSSKVLGRYTAFSSRAAGTLTTHELGMTFAFIPAGTFIRGNEGGASNERPVREITISQGFDLQTTEVTQEQWQAMMNNNPSRFQGENHPVDNVSWHDAQAFITKLNEQNDGYTYRLPTEAEWEYAARAGTESTYSWGNTPPVCQPGARNGARFDDNDSCDDSGTAPVGTYSPNAWGLYDMHGNVWEWVEDWYGSSYYSSSPNTDPTGLSSGSDRVLRGGSWNDYPNYLRAAYRGSVGPSYRGSGNGFRVVRTHTP